MKIVECPADGCTFDGARESVLGHYSGKQDEAHSGGYQDAKQMLDDSADGGSDTTPSKAPENPVVDGVKPSSDPAGSEPGSQTDVELPCGHESFSKDEAPDPPFVVTCSTCGEQSKVNSL